MKEQKRASQAFFLDLPFSSLICRTGIVYAIPDMGFLPSLLSQFSLERFL